MTYLDRRNPYLTLGVGPEADDSEVRKAFHDFVREGRDSENVRVAYEAIRNKENRFAYKWGMPSSFVNPLKRDENEEKLDCKVDEQLVYELAFLSDWELGVEQ